MKKISGIFIHSLFRTGSTYLWDKFRHSGAFHCYYEPFHHELAFLGTEESYRWKSKPWGAALMGHPLLDREYMQEYRHLLQPGQTGVPFFKKSFSFDDFCENGSNPAQKQYIDFLLANTGQRIPLLQFNRSALRVGWFKKNYPAAFHVYLLRNPQQQFSSFLNLQEKKNLDTFLLMNLLTVSVNKRKYYAFSELARCQPLFEYHAADYDQEEMFYRYLLSFYSYVEQYFIHYSIWFAALLENLAHADMFLNIDLLCHNSVYREQVNRCLENVAGTTLDFSDARIAKMEKFCFPEAEAGGIENDVRTMLLKMVDQKRIQELARRFDSENLNADNFSRKQWLDLQRRKLPPVDIREVLIAKQEAVFRKLSPRRVELENEASQIFLQIKTTENVNELKSLTKKHDSLSKELHALDALLAIPRGKSCRRRCLLQVVRRELPKAGLAGTPPPAQEITGLRGGMRLTGFQKKSQPGLPLVTVVTVVLNEVETLERTIASVLQQSYPNIELIVIDGGSAKPTLDVIKKFADKIDYWLSEPDRGIFDAMNKGIAQACGDWINFLNCGDCFYRSETVQTVFSQDYKDADFIYGHTDFQGGDFLGVVEAWDFDILWQTMIFTHQSLFCKTVILKKRNFNTKFRICADYDLIYNSWSSGLKYYNSDTVIASFNPGFSDVSRARMAWEKWRVVRRHRNDASFHFFYLQLFLRRLLRDIIFRFGSRLKKKDKS